MRARRPDHEGWVDCDGVSIGYEVFGAGEPTVLFVPASPITHSAEWKAQVPYLARWTRVVTYDGRGNGRSDRPTDPAAHTDRRNAADALAVMDAAGVERAVLVTHCHSTVWGLLLAAEHPERVLGIAAIAPGIAYLGKPHPHWTDVAAHFEAAGDDLADWRLCNRRNWQAGGYRSWIEFFFGELLPEAHSTKQFEDTVGWALETSPEVMLAAFDADGTVAGDPAQAEELCTAAGCPVLVIHGEQDRCQRPERGARVAELTGGRLELLPGSGHFPHARDPVGVNLILREFLARLGPAVPAAAMPAAAMPAEAPPAARPPPRRGRRRPRVLYLSSPIGLGHAHRDLAIAQELRARRPDAEIDWLAQHPVTRVLETAGERVHPASYELANESAHVESEAAEHDLHAFQAIRSMDEILVANFMVFHDLMEAGRYELVVGDEAWEVDYFLHEHPELKRSAYAWFTDFVGWLPMPDGGEREARLTADHNAEMIGQVTRHPHVRDRAIFVGDPEDIVPDAFGAALPAIRDWTRAHYAFTGYVTGFDPAAYADREALRAELGYRPGEQVCVVTVGGSGVGADLLRRAIAAFPLAARRIPGLRMVVVAGPRINPESLPAHEGLEVHAYVPRLYRHLAACDLAVVQGGLTTCMELTAAGRPFIYVPLRHHFEQNFHVPHRLRRYRAGRRLEYADADPDRLAELIAGEIGRGTDYRPVATGGAGRAADLLAELF